ncbi:MAG: glycosyl hydrolase 53 family protein [Bacteroidetes bacterium]|nr:glycosyl hydrolase 53 family protein [Bacteroidota bacterium]
MKYLLFFFIAFLLLLVECRNPDKGGDYLLNDRVKDGIPVMVKLTSYSTTLPEIKGETKLRITLCDSNGCEITSAKGTVDLIVEGDASIYSKDGDVLLLVSDTGMASVGVVNGECQLLLRAGKGSGKIKVGAKSEGLWEASHEIHVLPGNFVAMKPGKSQVNLSDVRMNKMIGADISFLPQLEDEGKRFYENGLEKDALDIFRDHGFNYIRLRIFVDPAHEKGYSPGKGYCGLSQTLALARRVKDAGMKILLDYHYSDYWADPQQQYKPASWVNAGFEGLCDSVRVYTERVLRAFQIQGTFPDMVQVGNEINHGILWPDGHIGNPDGLAALLIAGVEGVRSVDPGIPVIMHLALGGQNEEAIFWFDNMIARGVEFDIIGLSYYPRWHGTLKDLDANLRDLIKRYGKPVNVVEYSGFKEEVNRIVFNLPAGMGQGTCVWEPLNWHTDLFTNEGEVTEGMRVFDQMTSR